MDRTVGASLEPNQPAPTGCSYGGTERTNQVQSETEAASA